MSGSIFFDVCIHIFRKMSRRTAFKTNYDPVIQYLIEKNSRLIDVVANIVIIMMTGNTAA